MSTGRGRDVGWLYCHLNTDSPISKWNKIDMLREVEKEVNLLFEEMT